MSRNSDYEKIRQEIAKQYKNKYNEINNQLETACQIIDIKTDEIKDLKNKVQELEDENNKLKKIINKSPEEIDRLIKGSDSLHILATSSGLMKNLGLL